MTSGTCNRLRPTLLALAMILTAAQSATPDTDSLLRRLARPAPASIAFTEVRFSPLLKQPTIVSGELQYSSAASLDRRVVRPYREETQIRGDSVRVVREGESARSFGLARAPELRGLLTGFTALLGGDRGALEQEFTIVVSGSDQSWQLTLTPRDARTRKRLPQMQIQGSEDQPRCFSLSAANGGLSIMLLGSAAETPLAPSVTRAELQQRCDREMRRANPGADEP